MTDTTRPAPDHAAVPRLELSTVCTRPAPADRDLGRAILDAPLVRDTVWLRWSGHDGIRTLHHGAGLARGWVERDVDGLDGWAALVEGRLVVTMGSDGREQPVLHAEAWEAGATLHAALTQHPVHPGNDGHADEHEAYGQEADGEEEGLLDDVCSRVRRRAAGLTLDAIDQALAAAQIELRVADRYADAGDEDAAARAAVVAEEWQRIRGQLAADVHTAYDTDRDLDLQRALSAERHRRDIADRAREAAHEAWQTLDTAHRRLAGPAADPLYTALARAGLHSLADDDHQAVRELTRNLEATALRQVSDWLERTRAAALALGGDRVPPARPRARRSRL
ncbi:hypothetical protein ACIGZJ_17125 [Kitasatospora sp. NPDC052868]|uniref:hypothetical protein n=1 Tax=Kitasatospora sp. NPDC052868 TaxID=3364060 RepID=UPI0037C9D607